MRWLSAENPFAAIARSIFSNTFRARIFALFLFCIYLIVHSVFFKTAAQAQYPHIRLEKFGWPSGCEQKNYLAGDEISSQCAVYRVPEDFVRSYGLLYLRKIEYYRVGNDAIDFNCHDSRCYVAFIYKNIYYQ